MLLLGYNKISHSIFEIILEFLKLFPRNSFRVEPMYPYKQGLGFSLLYQATIESI